MSLKYGCYQSETNEVGQQVAGCCPACFALFTTLVECEKFMLLQNGQQVLFLLGEGE
jgi:hypothetical protein